MVSVAPTVRDLPDASRQISSGKSSWRDSTSRLLRLWKRMQVSYYGGKYSIHRALALDEYTRNTSFGRVLAVCAAAPVPMIVLVFVQELIPLQALNEGWHAHYGLWIRTAVLVCISTHAIVVQMTYLIDDFTVPVHQMLQLYVLVPSLLVAFAMVISANLVFPIPFFVLFVMPVFFLLLVISLRVVVGSRGIDHLLSRRGQLVRCIRFVCAQSSTIVIFPAYEMFFRASEGTKYQVLVIMLLPAIKVAAKNVVLHFAKNLEDMVPVEVIFTADFFNAVYVATCMQNASSVVAVSAITITDLSQTIVMLYGLQRRTSSILSRLRQTQQNAADNDSMLAMICLLCRNPTSFRKQAHTGIRKRSRLPHQISMASRRLLDSLDEVLNETGAEEPQTPPGTLKTTTNHCRSPSSCFRLIFTQRSVHPVVLDADKSTREASVDTFRPPESSKSYQHLATHAPKRPTILLESLETLFTTECLVITAYLEAFMPLFYCSYMLAMILSPNAQYHTEMAGITRQNVVATILPLFVFGLLQIASFVLLVVVIMRNCGMRALYQLAFVLKTQRSLIQCKMMLWMVITLCFRVVHFGVDFKFEFLRLGFPKFWTPMG